MKRYFLILVLISWVSAQDFTAHLIPTLSWDIKLRSGYDSNSLRLSSDEQDEAGLEPTILGSVNTFDSYYQRIAARLTGRYRLSGNKQELEIRLEPSLTGYMQVSQKRYSGVTLSVDYTWGAYRHLVGQIRRLNQYYLRDYRDRDRSTENYAGCYFSDADHSLELSLPLAYRVWLAAEGGYLQRYYEKPFTEFDLDIYYGSLRFNSSRWRPFTVGLRYKYGYAANITLHATARASTLDRSYRFVEIYLPLRYRMAGTMLSSVGINLKTEMRQYAVEDYDDPLHSGRFHRDVKLDFWVRRPVSRDINLELTLRHRTRTTDSAFEWVEDLKSFRQIQCRLDLTWKLY